MSQWIEGPINVVEEATGRLIGLLCVNPAEYDEATVNLPVKFTESKRPSETVRLRVRREPRGDGKEFFRLEANPHAANQLREGSVENFELA